MALSFEIAAQISPGTSPVGFHASAELCQVIYINDSNWLDAITAKVPYGQWAGVTWSKPVPAARDTEADSLRLSHVPGVGVYATWLNGEVDQRVGAFEAAANLSPYLVRGTMTFDRASLANSIQLELDNPRHQLLTEDVPSVLYPGAKLIFQFRAGDSEVYPVGVRYIDRAETDATGGTISIEGRNTIGRLLVDQTFDEQSIFHSQSLQHTFEAVLEAAEVPNYVVGGTSFDVGMQFPPEMSFYEGLQELLKTVSNWKMAEDVNGTIRIGFISGPHSPHDQPGNYTFQRGQEVFSRRILRDDVHSYSRVCAHTADGTVRVYRSIEVPENWEVPPSKTFYSAMAEGTTLAVATDHAEALAEQFAQIGIIETFTGPFRPHLQPGDQATIVSDGTERLLGVITTVTHTFGRQGYITEFVVDSGGRVSKPTLAEHITAISSTSAAGTAKRLYT